MYSLLIADDDKWIRTGLKEFIQWEKYGINKIYEAKSGKEALKVIQTNPIDILITDVRMPDLDGLELTKVLKTDFPTIKVIIISGYEYFEYAKKALIYGAYNYILKPIKEDEIIDQIKSCIQLIQKEKDQASILSKQLVSDILNNGIINTDEMVYKLEFSKLLSNHEKVVIFGIQLDTYLADNKTIIDTQTQQKLNLILEREFFDWIKDTELRGMTAITEDRTVYGYISAPTNIDLEYLREQFLHICNIRHGGLSYHTTVALSDILESPNEWHMAKQQIRRILKRKFFEGKSRVLTYEQFVNDHKLVKYTIDPDKEKALINCVFCNDYPRIHQILNKIYEDINKQKDILASENIKYVYSKMIDQLYHELFKKRFISIDDIEPIETLDELQTYTRQNIKHWMDEYHKNKNKVSQQVIREVLKYIEENYHQKINLESCANQIYMNASYISDLFSREIGETFTHYLKKIRIQHAKEMLCDTNLKVYEIAEKVGYHDEKYFTKVFKDLVGVTPKTYRDNR